MRPYVADDHLAEQISVKARIFVRDRINLNRCHMPRRYRVVPSDFSNFGSAGARRGSGAMLDEASLPFLSRRCRPDGRDACPRRASTARDFDLSWRSVARRPFHRTRSDVGTGAFAAS